MSNIAIETAAMFISQFFSKKSYKNSFFVNFVFSYFSMYLQKYLTYRDVLYLKKILERFCFDHLKCNALEDWVRGVEIKMCVHFFLRHPLNLNDLILPLLLNLQLKFKKKFISQCHLQAS